MTAVPTVSPEIPDELVSLGVILGVLTSPNGTGPQLNTAWFADPVAETSGVLADPDRRSALIDLAEDLLGSVIDDIDLPDIDPEEEHWIPIIKTGEGPTTGGLFVIIDMRSGNPVISLGARAAVENDGLTASLTLRVPMIEAGGAALQVLVGTEQGAIEVAANVSVAGLGVPGVVTLSGVSFAASLPTDGGDPTTSIVLKGLQLPGDPTPAEVSLGDFIEELDVTALEILIGLLRSQADVADEVEDLLALIGLDPASPIPELPIADIVENGVVSLRAWLADVIEQALEDWLQRLAHFLGVGAVSGSGTSADPYRICLDDPPVHGCLTLEVATDIQTGATTLKPGATLEVEAPAGSTVEGNLSSNLTFATLVLNHSLNVQSGPSLRTFAELGDGDLVDTNVEGFDVEVGSLRAGIVLTTAGTIEPMVEAVDVTIGSDDYPILDLTSVDAVTEAAAGALDNVVDALLNSLGVDDIRESEAIAVLAGLQPPDGAPPDWPDTVGLAAFFSDPIGAIGCYHAAVLEEPGRWSLLAREIGVLLAGTGAAPISVDGTGTRPDPWAVTLFDNLGAGDPVEGVTRLIGWSDPAAVGNGTTTLHLELEIVPALPDVDGATLTLDHRTEVVRISLPPPDSCPGPVSMTWAPAHTALLRLEPLDLNADPIHITADFVEMGGRSERGGGFDPTAAAQNLAFEIDGADFDLGDFSIGDLFDLDAFGDLPWEGIQILLANWLSGFDVDFFERLTKLFGWFSGDAGQFQLPQLPDLDLDFPEFPALDLGDLLVDPLNAILDWLKGLFGNGGDLPGFLPVFAELGDLLGDVAQRVTGTGTHEDPWALPLGSSGADALVWADPKGPSLAGLTDIVEHLLPDDVLDAAEPDLDQVLGLLERAAGLSPELKERLGSADLPAAVAALRERLEGDGLVTKADQQPTGWTLTEMAPTAHLLEPASFTMPTGTGAVQKIRRIFVTSAVPGVSDWPDQEAATIVDLTEPRIRPESIDLSPITEGAGWVVLLPSEADAEVPDEPDISGFDRLVARLVRAVDHIHSIVGGNLALIGHSTAGQVARVVASRPASESHIAHLITVGTPHGGSTFEFLDRVETGEALRVLQRLRGLLDEATESSAELEPLTRLLNTIDTALDPYVEGEGGVDEFIPFPVDDFLVPPTYPDVDAATTAHAVVGKVVPDDLDGAIVAFVRRVIEAAIGLLPVGDSVTHLGFGLRTTLVAADTTPGLLSTAARARLDLHRVRVGDGESDRTVPLLSADLELRRNDGWLLGGPDPTQPVGTPRDPRVRWLEASLVIDLASLDDGELEIVLHDAAVFGTHKDRWVIDRGAIDDTADTLVPEARILLGEAASQLRDLATNTAISRLAKVLEALGLAELGSGQVALVADAVERFLTDPVGETRASLSTHEGAIRSAAATWLGVPIPSNPVVIPLGEGISFSADLQRVAVEVSGFELGDLITTTGTVGLARDGTVGYDVKLGTNEAPGPLGSVVVRVHGESGTDPRIEIDGVNTEDLPALVDAPIPIVPLDSPRLIEFSISRVAGEFGRRLLEHLRSTLPSGQADGFNDVLDLVGMLRQGGQIRNPTALLERPFQWFTVPTTLGTPASLPSSPAGLVELGRDRLRELLDAVGEFFGVAGPPGMLPLPWDMSATVDSMAGGGVAINVGWDTPVAGPATELSGGITVSVAPGFDVSTAIAATAEVSGDGLDHARLDLRVNGEVSLALAIRPQGGAETVLTLLPSPSGFESLAAAAAGAGVRSLLPLVLDAVANNPQIGAAVASLGDDLGVRVGGAFSTSELAALVADPATEFVSRLRAQADAILADIATLIDDITTAGAIVVSGRTITITPESGYEATIEVPTSGPVTVCLEVDDGRPIDQMRTDVSLCFGSTGLASLAIILEIDDPNFLVASGISFLPRVAFLMGAAAGTAGNRFEAGLWIDDPGTDPRRGIFTIVPFAGDTSVVCRQLPAGGTPSDTGTDDCIEPLLRTWIMPIAAELVVAVDEVKELLDGAVGSTAETLGEMLEDAGILDQPNPDEWHLVDGVFDDLQDRFMQVAAQVVEAVTDSIDVETLQIGLISRDAGSGRTEYGIEIDLTEDLIIATGSDVRVSITKDGDGADVEVYLFSILDDTGAPDFPAPEFALGIGVDGLGLRVDHPQEQKLIDLVASLDAIRLLGTFSLDSATAGEAEFEEAKLEFIFENLTIPIGSVEGSNPVAAALLSSDTEDNQAGDPEDVAPALSPRLILTVAPSPDFDLRLDVTEEGPWWIPIQKSFGPIYIEQVGGDVARSDGRVDSVTILLDGGVELAGLAVGVDDLGLTIEWDEAWDVTEWELDLKGLAIGYSGSGVTLAGGLVKNELDDGVEYVGLIQVDALSFGLAAVGAYGQFPDPELPDSTYTSLFVVAAVSASLGGPPFFFVTGLGGGAGLNRALELPDDVTGIPGFPLVATMDSASGFAEDPMGVLQSASTAFPARRGNFWFAAGVRFTSFVLIETVAVLAVEVGDEVEIALLGLSRAVLPDPKLPIANVELALIARFSSEEGVLWVQAQLTDNSWLLSKDCRLSGGFAFVTWFNRGEFVFTMGGYHPRFAAPDYYPTVPRLGFNWNVSGAIVIKGENYFALTSSAIMAGGRLEASYTTSTVWASFVAGLDAIVSWDPFFYDVEIYVRVSAGIKIRVCFIKCATIRMSFSIGARVRVWGPELQGRVKLELGPVTVTVKFGANAQPEVRSIPWPDFVDKFLIQGNPSDESMTANVIKGLLVPDPGSGTDLDDGSLASPWRVNPEFSMAFETRAASNEVRAGGQSQEINEPIDIAPVGITDVQSVFRITITSIQDNEEVTDNLKLLTAEPSQLPDAPWYYVAREARAPTAGHVTALTSGLLIAPLTDTDDDIMVDLDDVDPSDIPHPLPFPTEQADRENFDEDVVAAATYLEAQPTATREVLVSAATGIESLTAGEVRTFLADRVSPPRLAPLTEGMVDAVRPQFTTRPIEPEEPTEDVDRSTQPPMVMAVIRRPVSSSTRPQAQTSVEAPAEVPRVTAPTLAAVASPGGTFPRAKLTFGPSRVTRAAKTIKPVDGLPRTKPALRGKEIRGGFRASPRVAGSLDLMANRMLNGGLPVEAGDVILLKMPNARFDRHESRPELHFEGNQDIRVVGLDRAGSPLFDTIASRRTVDLPVGTDRMAVVGLGTPTPQPDGAGLAGWHARATMQQIHSGTFLGVRSVIRSASNRTRRTGSPVTMANVTGAAAAAGSSVTTHLPGDTTVVLVGLSATDQASTLEEAFSSISLGLFGADRRTGGDGRPSAPIIVVSGDQVHGIFAVTPNPAGGPWVTVSIESDQRWSVTAVAGTTGQIESLADDLRDSGIDALFTDGADPAGRSKVRFVVPEGPKPKPHRRREPATGGRRT